MGREEPVRDMKDHRRILGILPSAVSIGTLLILGFYFLPHLVYFTRHPAVLFSEDAAQMVIRATGPDRERALSRMMTKNVQGVVFHEETLGDLESSGRVFIASGEELIRIFKLQSVASYYVYEQIRNKNIDPAGSYLFFSDAAVFERVYAELRRRLPPGSIKVYERGIFRGDASFPDNFILESKVSQSDIRSLSFGWPAERIRRTLRQLQVQRGDTMWPVLWSESASPVPSHATDTDMQLAIRLDLPLLRFPYDSIRIVQDPFELVQMPVSSSLSSVLSMPQPASNLPMVLAVCIVLAAALRLYQWTVWAYMLSAILLVSMFVLLPGELSWVLGGLAGLLPPCILFSWMTVADDIRAKKGGILKSPISMAIFVGWASVLIGSAGWILSTLFWQYPYLPLSRCSEYGILIIPGVAAVLFIAVWGIKVANHPIYPRHLRTGMEIIAAGWILFAASSMWILLLAGTLAWARWVMSVERTRGQVTENSPGNYTAFFAASAFGLKLFFTHSPLSSIFFLAVSISLGALIASAWLSRTSSTNAG